MEIRPIKKSEWEKLRAFNEAVYRPGHVLTDKVYYDWQFDNPWNSDKDYYQTIGLFGKNGDLFGTFGRFALPYNYHGKIVEGNCLANLIVKEDLRSLGYGYLLLDEAASFGDLAIDHTINDSAWPLFIKSGWHGENLKRYLYIINPENALFDLPASTAPKEKANSLSFVSVEDFDAGIDNFWELAKKRYPITPERGSAYLNWRYARNPLTKYKMFAAKSGADIKGLVILRLEDVRKEKPIDARVGRIIDFVSEPEADQFLFSKAVEYCRNHRVDFVDYFSSGNFHDSALGESGFVDGDRPPYGAIPILYNPVSFKRAHLNFAVRVKGTIQLSDWYTTKGGGDQDRP